MSGYTADSNTHRYFREDDVSAIRLDAAELAEKAVALLQIEVEPGRPLRMGFDAARTYLLAAAELLR